MDQVFEYLVKWGWTIVNLVVGVVVAIMAVAGYYPKEKRSCSAGVTVVLLSGGTVMMVVSLLHLLGSIQGEWVTVSWYIVWGLLWIMEGTAMLSTPPAASARRWLFGGRWRWLFGALGAGMIVIGALHALVALSAS